MASPCSSHGRAFPCSEVPPSTPPASGQATRPSAAANPISAAASCWFHKTLQSGKTSETLVFLLSLNFPRAAQIDWLLGMVNSGAPRPTSGRASSGSAPIGFFRGERGIGRGSTGFGVAEGVQVRPRALDRLCWGGGFQGGAALDCSRRKERWPRPFVLKGARPLPGESKRNALCKAPKMARFDEPGGRCCPWLALLRTLFPGRELRQGQLAEKTGLHCCWPHAQSRETPVPPCQAVNWRFPAAIGVYQVSRLERTRSYSNRGTEPDTFPRGANRAGHFGGVRQRGRGPPPRVQR